MFKKAKLKAFAILANSIGEIPAKGVFLNIRWSCSNIIPKAAREDFPADFQWMGFCVPMTDGTATVIINPDTHQDADEMAFTIGHEIAHVLQFAITDQASHDGEIFETMRKMFSDALGYMPEGF